MEKYKESIRQYLYCFILGPFFMVVEACGEFVLPYLNANMINIGAANGDIGYILRYGFYMLLIAAVMLAAGVLGGLFCHKRIVASCGGCEEEDFCADSEVLFC